MTRRKYVCDYCEKTFYDDPQSRKRHFGGANHQRSKAKWFADCERQDEERTRLAAQRSAQLCPLTSNNVFCPQAVNCPYFKSTPNHNTTSLLQSEALKPVSKTAAAEAYSALAVHIEAKSKQFGSPEQVGDIFQLLPPSLRPFPPETDLHRPISWG